MGFSPRVARALGVLLLALSLGVRANAARAAPKASDAKAVEAARTQFYRALALQDQGRWAEALALLEKVAETRESAQVRFNIAFNQEHLGRLAVAARGYEQSIALAEEGGSENVIRAANERLALLSARIARLLLRPAGEGVSVSVDGVELAPRDYGRAVPVEVGDHTIRAEAAGYKPYRLSVNLPAGETRELRIELEPARAEAAASVGPPTKAVAPVVAPKPPSAPAPAPPPPRNPRQSKPSALPFIAGAAAIVGFSTAGIFYALRDDALDTMRAGCQGGTCPDELQATDEKGALYTTVANVALAAGVGLSGVSAGLFISELGDDEGRREVTVRASVRTSF
jgi:hypothetical protein